MLKYDLRQQLVVHFNCVEIRLNYIAATFQRTDNHPPPSLSILTTIIIRSSHDAISKMVMLVKPCSSARQEDIAEITSITATQGKTHDENEACCAADHAIDRDLSTHAKTETNDGAVWLKLEFDKTYFIHKVVIYTRFYTDWYYPGGWCVQTVSRFISCVDSENNVDVSVYQGDVKQKSCGTLQLTYGLEQSDQIYHIYCRARGDMIKFSKSAGNIAVFEVSVTGAGTLFGKKCQMLAHFFATLTSIYTTQIRDYHLRRARYFRGRVSNFGQSEVRKHCFLTSDCRLAKI